eukprot:SAG31_NODE_1886_length_6989_cov_6.914514_1_plen_140_part_00
MNSSPVSCRLELQFGKQSGTPIIPVVAEREYKAQGWLALITAGALWVPLFDEMQFESGVEQIAHQVKLPDSRELVLVLNLIRYDLTLNVMSPHFVPIYLIMIVPYLTYCRKGCTQLQQSGGHEDGVHSCAGRGGLDKYM